MKLHGLARVKNEGDVIEEFVRHNLQFLDALTVVDNVSFDGTRAVLEALRAEGLPLTVLHDPILSKRQYETITRVARRSAAEADWDFLFLLDADEFIKVRDRNRLEESLAVLAPGENGLLPWFPYVPTEQDDTAEPRVLSRITYRRDVETNPAFHKLVLSGGYARSGPFSIIQGNHGASGVDGAAPAVVVRDVGLAHFPVRSVVQIQSKVLLGWGAYLVMGYDSVGYGWHQRRLFHRLESEPAWSVSDLRAIAQHYTDAEVVPDGAPLTHDPLPPVPEWRYGNVAIANPMQLAAMYVRQLATAIGERDATEPAPPRAATDR
jgi:hypothetical protein